MQHNKNNFYRQEDNEWYTAATQILEDNLFVHIFIKQWSASAFKDMKLKINQLIKEAGEAGHSVVFVTTENESILKLGKKLRGFDEVVTLTPGTWLGAWYTGV